ncbi:MAG: hypothetical protein OER90_12915, partial [Gemmatimonadota bacterium]|nr:hypothetical protein [Gemmatimonadota bacterium]
GVPVAFYGMVGYLALIVVSFVGLQPRWVEFRWPTGALVAIAALGVAFSGYLTYLEAAVIHAWCRWCVVSAVLIAAVLVVALGGLWTMRSTAATPRVAD